jgi:carboxymethylenebutenolidase
MPAYLGAMPMITIADTSAADRAGRRPAYLARPVPVSDRPAPWPGVVVIHDAFGMTDDIKEQADWLAAAGYLALVPDLYNGQSMVRCIKSTFSQLMAQQGPVFTQIDAARTHLEALPDCTGRVGVIGYCMGGAFALLIAARPGYSAASVNYGPLPKNLDEILAGSCPMVASYGAKDTGLKGAARKLELGLARAGVPSDVKEYPNARHSFINRLAVASPLSVLMKVAGVGYDHDSAADAKQRILAFFDEHLVQATPAGTRSAGTVSG